MMTYTSKKKLFVITALLYIRMAAAHIHIASGCFFVARKPSPPGSQIQYYLSMIWLLGTPLGFQIQYAGTKVS